MWRRQSGAASVLGVCLWPRSTLREESVCVLEQAALDQWVSILGSENVIAAGDKLRAAGTATFPVVQTISAILRPATRDEVRQCLQVATHSAVSVYPVSSGKNWGYGSSVPVTDGCVLLDLSRMSRILDFSEELAYVTVEPGVTQDQLFEFLRSRNSRLWIDATGSSPDCSLVGNVLERGFGHTPYGEHIAQVCDFEVVLANGELLETGAARFPGALAAPVYRWGLGASLDGLFAQSNFGVITRLTLWLMPAPEYFQAFFFRCDNHGALSGLIDALRPLRLSGTLRSAIHVANDYRVLAGIRQYPWTETGGATPLSEDVMKNLRREMNIGAWNGSGGLYGTKGQVAEARRVVRRALSGKTDRLQFLDDRRIALASRFSTLFRLMTNWDISRALELAMPVYGLMKGIPTRHALRSTYWRKRQPPPENPDPDRDRCGLLWSSHVAPLQGRHGIALAEIASRVLLSHGFEPMLSFTAITGRALLCVISITFDRDAPGEDRRALDCYAALQRELESKGFFPYRLSINAMAAMRASGAYGMLLEGIKRITDPWGIIAPGRYGVDIRGVKQRGSAS